MRDFNGQNVEPGDVVTYFQGGRYDSINLCRVEALTPKCLRLKVIRSSRRSLGPAEIVIAAPGRCVKVHPDLKEGTDRAAAE